MATGDVEAMKEQIENLLHEFTTKTGKVVKAIKIDLVDVRVKNPTPTRIVRYTVKIELREDDAGLPRAKV